MLKGSFTIFLFFVRTHILNSNGVWYSWIWLEGPINAQNSTFLGFHFVPRDLDSRRHKGPRLAAPWDLDSNQWRCESRSLGTKWKPKNFEFLPFIDPSGQNQLYHTPLLSKIWDLNDRKKLWTISLIAIYIFSKLCFQDISVIFSSWRHLAFAGPQSTFVPTDPFKTRINIKMYF